MRKLIISFSRAVFGWPPASATFMEKRTLISRIAREHGLEVFVETGTFKGEMIEAQSEQFQKLVSIELSEELYAAARQKFLGCSKVNLHQGDSGKKLREVAVTFREPALFWLDAHYSGRGTACGDEEVPIFRELSCIAERQQPKDVILIDDARLFGLKSAYPKKNALQQFASKHLPKHSFCIESDVICLVPT